MSFFDRWRAANPRRERIFLPAGTPTVKTPSYETAQELVDVLRKHGFVAEVTRPQGRKVALEKGDGVTAVRLSLGSGGEFMYAVTHRPDVDVAALAGESLPGASIQRNAEGVVQLSAGKPR